MNNMCIFIVSVMSLISYAKTSCSHSTPFNINDHFSTPNNIKEIEIKKHKTLTHLLKIKNIKTSCREIPEISENFDIFVKSVVVEGLQKIASINPKLFAKARKRLFYHRVRIDCYKPKRQSIFAAGKYVPFLNKITLGGMGLHDTRNFVLNSQSIINSDDNFMKTALIAYKNIIFHEFLHFFKFDNVRNKIHNAGYTKNDLVYSCSFIAYPYNLTHAIDYDDALNACKLKKYSH